MPVIWDNVALIMTPIMESRERWEFPLAKAARCARQGFLHIMEIPVQGDCESVHYSCTA